MISIRQVLAAGALVALTACSTTSTTGSPTLIGTIETDALHLAKASASAAMNGYGLVKDAALLAELIDPALTPAIAAGEALLDRATAALEADLAKSAPIAAAVSADAAAVAAQTEALHAVIAPAAAAATAPVEVLN